MNQILSNRTALISGGLGDIGKAIAALLASSGARIALGDLHPPGTEEEFAASIRSLGVGFHYSQVDVADAAAVEAWVENVAAGFGEPDLIIPNAAIATFASFEELQPAQWEQELRVNLNGAYHLAHYATRRLVRIKRPGRVVFIGSWAGHTVHRHIPAYCVSKAGLRMLCKCLALELAAHDILVNEVAPGYVHAGLSGRSFDRDPAVREAARQKVPVGKLIAPEQVAREVLHLCDPRNEHITGSTVLIDGGLSLLC